MRTLEDWKTLIHATCVTEKGGYGRGYTEAQVMSAAVKLLQCNGIGTSVWHEMARVNDALDKCPCWQCRKSKN